MNDLSKPVEIADNLFWVGSENTHKYLQCNPYLYISGETGVLFDPGSALDGEIVIEKVKSLIPLSHLEQSSAAIRTPTYAWPFPCSRKRVSKALSVVMNVLPC